MGLIVRHRAARLNCQSRQRQSCQVFTVTKDVMSQTHYDVISMIFIPAPVATDDSSASAPQSLAPPPPNEPPLSKESLELDVEEGDEPESSRSLRPPPPPRDPNTRQRAIQDQFFDRNNRRSTPGIASAKP